mmetsp:Transcript_9715/g.41672  ORF Transcript_9715/g.41672 Transcript_9715/m.41672 type:complete len:123 (+) Transcript_9715:145-513(+)
MSGWENYTRKMETEGCYKSAIVGHNGVTWAHTGGFRIREEEVAHVLEILKEDDMHELQSGFNVAGKPFAFIRGEFNYDDDYELTWFVGRHKRVRFNHAIDKENTYAYSLGLRFSLPIVWFWI